MTSQAVLDHLSGLRALARYGTHQETISGRPEQKFPPSDQDRNGLWRGYYSSLHTFVSFKLPFPTDKKLINVTLLPRKSEKRCKKEIS